MKHTKEYLSYALGAFGHDAFYATLNTYFIFFVTSQLFNSSDKASDAKMIGMVTTTMLIIRLVEIAFDPILGGVVDNTRSRWGKFKPWIFIGALISSLTLSIAFTTLGGLSVNNPTLYIAAFALIFIILDVFYSFKDIAFWSMLPALSVDSHTRSRFGSIARIGSTLGAQGVVIAVLPLVYYFSHTFSGTTGTTASKAGWLGFGITIALVSFLGAMATVWGTKEETSLIRENTEKVSVIGVFKAIGKNDQLMWLALSYLLFAFGFAITNALMIYYFTYVLAMPAAFPVFGWITVVLGLISVSLFPWVESLIGRKNIYLFGIAIILIGYVIFLTAGKNLMAVYVGIGFYFFPNPMIFLAVLMTITDSVEYGQLKNGTRNESVTLAVRPLLDKLAGALSNGVVGLAAIAVGMTGGAKASDISAVGITHFKIYMLYGPMVLLIIAAIIFGVKIFLTEEKHAEIVKKLQAKLEAEKAAGEFKGDTTIGEQR